MADEEAPQPSMSPPTEHEPVEEQTQSSWPKTIGVITLIYAIGGLVCQVGLVGSTLANEWLMSLANMDVTVPATVKLTAASFGVVLLGLGILLLVGGVQLLRRRPSSIKLLKTWVVLRLVVLVVGVVVGFLTMPMQVNFQLELQAARNDALREAGQTDQVRDLTPEQIRRQITLQSFVASAAFAIYPLFLGFYLSRRKVSAEVEQWDRIE